MLNPTPRWRVIVDDTEVLASAADPAPENDSIAVAKHAVMIDV